MTCRRMVVWLALLSSSYAGAFVETTQAQPAPAQRPAVMRDTSLRADTGRQGRNASGDSTRADRATQDSVPQDSSKATAAVASGDSTAKPSAVTRNTPFTIGGYTVPQFITLIAVLSVLVMLALSARRLFDAYAELVRKDESLGVSSHWGGFGGGASGWRASRALSMLVGGVLLVAATTTLAVAVIDIVLRDDPPKGKSEAPATGAAGAEG